MSWLVTFVFPPFAVFFHEQLDSALQVCSIIEQVSLTLAVGETALELEHRSLSVDHILVQESCSERLQFCLMGDSISVDTHGVKANIIDFSTARMISTPGRRLPVITFITILLSQKSVGF